MEKYFEVTLMPKWALQKLDQANPRDRWSVLHRENTLPKLKISLPLNSEEIAEGKADRFAQTLFSWGEPDDVRVVCVENKEYGLTRDMMTYTSTVSLPSFNSWLLDVIKEDRDLTKVMMLLRGEGMSFQEAITDKRITREVLENATFYLGVEMLDVAEDEVLCGRYGYCAEELYEFIDLDKVIKHLIEKEDYNETEWGCYTLDRKVER